MKTSSLLAGREGMTLIEYTGKASSDMTWYGPSGQRYKAGGLTKVFRVDDKDVNFFLHMDSPDTFRLYKPVAELKATKEAIAVNYYPVVEAKAVNTLPEAEITPVASVSEETATVTPIAMGFDPNEKTVSEIIDKATGLDSDEIRAILELEQAGKNRKTAVKALEDILEGQ